MGVLTWGIERYRSRFEKMDLLIGVVLASGILLFIFLPAAFDRLGDFLDLQNRFAMVSLLANLALLALVLFYASVIRDVKGDLSDLTRNLTIKQAPHADGGREQIFVIIPAYNEGKTIQSVVKSLPDVVRGYEIQPVVVSDGSGDDTARNAKYNGTIVMEHPINQGQGGALKTGFEVANQNGASIVVTMDGDGQHPTDELDRLVSPIIDDEADYVMGSRYIGEDQSGNGPIRRAGIQFYTWLINVLTKSDITDCTNGYRAIRGSMLEELTLTEEQFSAPELIIEARKSGMRIKEIPITIEERQAGDTKKPKLGYAAGLMRTILVTWIR
jgi:hypothetical protein